MTRPTVVLTERNYFGRGVVVAVIPKIYREEEPIIAEIGRAEDNYWQLKRDFVSRHHARIMIEEGRVTLEDIGSRYGTYLNNEELEAHEPVSLIGGEEIIFGGSCRFQVIVRKTIVEKILGCLGDLFR